MRIDLRLGTSQDKEHSCLAQSGGVRVQRSLPGQPETLEEKILKEALGLHPSFEQLVHQTQDPSFYHQFELHYKDDDHNETASVVMVTVTTMESIGGLSEEALADITKSVNEAGHGGVLFPPTDDTIHFSVVSPLQPWVDPADRIEMATYIDIFGPTAAEEIRRLGPIPEHTDEDDGALSVAKQLLATEEPNPTGGFVPFFQFYSETADNGLKAVQQAMSGDWGEQKEDVARAAVDRGKALTEDSKPASDQNQAVGVADENIAQHDKGSYDNDNETLRNIWLPAGMAGY